jgi:hypothetical protein
VTDAEIREALRALDQREDVELTSWECAFVEDILWRHRSTPSAEPPTWPLSARQREKAIEILDRYEFQKTGEQETVRRIPPGAARYFRSQP